MWVEAITWKKNELLSLEFVDRLWNRDISSLSSNGSDLEKRRWKCLRRSRTRSRRPWQCQFCAFGSRRSKYGHGTRFEPNICLKGTTGAIVWLPNEWVWRSAILKKLGLGPRESWRLPSSKPVSYCCRAPTGEIGTLSSHVESVFSPVIQVTLWALPRATTGTVQNEDCWTRRFHLVSTLWLGFHSQSCLTMLTTCDSDLITPLLLSCIFTVHMNPPLLVCRSKEPLLETGFTLIGLSNQLRGSVTQRASIFLICAP